MILALATLAFGGARWISLPRPLPLAAWVVVFAATALAGNFVTFAIPTILARIGGSPQHPVYVNVVPSPTRTFNADLVFDPDAGFGQVVTVVVPATAFLDTDQKGRVFAATTNTGCPPRASDGLWLRHPDGLLEPAPMTTPFDERGWSRIGVVASPCSWSPPIT